MNQNKYLGAALVSLLVVMIVVILSQQGSEKSGPLAEVVVPGTIGLDRTLAASSVAPQITESSRRVDIYLDVSEPMAGYLAPREGEELGFRHVGQAAAAQLLRAYGSIETVQWHRVANSVDPLPDRPSWRRGDFNGAETFLDLPAKKSIAELVAGETEVAAILTDLVATREVAGGLGLSNVLHDWLASEAVQAGHYDLGLLGVKVPYRGVSSSRCQGTHSGLGCWFSEGASRWKPMTEAVDRPLYVLVFGRAENSAGPDRVDAFGKGLLDSLEELGFVGQWQVLTHSRRDRAAAMSCQVEGLEGKSQQFVMRLEPEGGFRCLQDGVVHFDCQLAYVSEEEKRGELVPRLSARSLELSWPAAWARADVMRGGGVTLAIDCGQLRSEPRSEDLELTNLEVSVSENNPWSSWSSESDEPEASLGKTLQLAYFVEQVQPNRVFFRAEAPILEQDENR